MGYSEFLLWAAVMLPLICSPGPANIAIASISAGSGFRAALVFTAGIFVVNCIVTAFLGLGMGALYEQHTNVFSVLERAGALYILYLGHRTLQSVPGDEGDEVLRTLGFRDGLTMQVLNSKLYPVLIMMFSQFLDGASSTGYEVAELCILTVIVSQLNYVGWAGLGRLIGRAKGERAERIQRCSFGTLLIAVGLWLLF